MKRGIIFLFIIIVIISIVPRFFIFPSVFSSNNTVENITNFVVKPAMPNFLTVIESSHAQRGTTQNRQIIEHHKIDTIDHTSLLDEQGALKVWILSIGIFPTQSLANKQQKILEIAGYKRLHIRVMQALSYEKKQAAFELYLGPSIKFNDLLSVEKKIKLTHSISGHIMRFYP